MVGREIDLAITVEWLIMLTLVVAGQKVDAVAADGIMHRVHPPAGRPAAVQDPSGVDHSTVGGRESIDYWPI